MYATFYWSTMSTHESACVARPPLTANVRSRGPGHAGSTLKAACVAVHDDAVPVPALSTNSENVLPVTPALVTVASSVSVVTTGPNAPPSVT